MSHRISMAKCRDAESAQGENQVADLYTIFLTGP